MINILPQQLKQDFRYGILNRHLLRWNLALLAAVVGVYLIVAAGNLTMDSTIHAYNKQMSAASNQLKTDDITGAQKQVSDISNNLKLMVQVLSKEILFSKLLARLGSITPPNVILTNLSINQNENAIDVTAESANYTSATQLQVNMADSTNQIFSNADIISIACTAGNQVTNHTYPCTADIRGLFTLNNPFLFTNSKAGS